MKILSTRATSPIGLKWNKYLGTFSQSSTNVGLSGGAAEPLFPSKVVLLVPKQRGQRGEWGAPGPTFTTSPGRQRRFMQANGSLP